MSYYDDKAKELGIEVFVNLDNFDKLVQKLEDLVCDFRDENGDAIDMCYDSGDSVVCCHRDEGWVSAIIDILGLCHKFPSRTKWVIGFHDHCEYTYAHVFACDSEEEATKRVKKEATRLRKLLKVQEVQTA